MLRLTLISLITTMPLVVHANTVINLESISCSGGLSVSSLSGASLSCDGNLRLNSGLINSESSIFIQAGGDLLLENLNLSAPEISFSTITGNLEIASTANIQNIQLNPRGPLLINPLPNKRDIIWNNFNIGLHPGANIQISTPGTNSNAINHLTGAGEVYVINRAGIVFQNTSAVNFTTAGFITINNPISVSSVPEANTGVMLLLGLGMLALRRRSL